MLLDTINELDDQLFNGIQKYERTVALYVHHLLCSLCLTIDSRVVSQRLPVVVRSFPISLGSDYGKQIFPILSSTGQQTTDIDVLFIGCPSPFGHEGEMNYYVEVEMHQRDHMAFQRLRDFSDFCKAKKVNLFPILVTNQRQTGYVSGDICVINFDNLKTIAGACNRHLLNSEDIPGLAWDDATICFYILDLLSRQERTVKSDLMSILLDSSFLWQKQPDFQNFVIKNISLRDCLQQESEREFRNRMNKYLIKLKERELICDTRDGRAYQITPLGSKYIIRWRGGSHFVRGV